MTDNKFESSGEHEQNKNQKLDCHIGYRDRRAAFIFSKLCAG